MAVNIINYAAQLLCQQGTVSQCQQLISQYPDVMNQIFFFLLFPIVFLIIFVYILSDAAVPKVASKFKFLIAIVMFVFIIIQGYYHIFALVSKFWLYFVVLLVGLWIFLKYIIFRRHDSSGRGGGTSPAAFGSRGSGGSLGSVTKLAIKTAKGDITDLKKKVNDRMINLRGAVDRFNNPHKGDTISFLDRNYWEAKREAEEALKELEKTVKVDVPILGQIKASEKGEIKKYWDEINRLSRKYARISKKSGW